MRWSLAKPATLGDALHLHLIASGRPAPPSRGRKPEPKASVTAAVRRKWIKRGENAPAAVDWWFAADGSS